MLLVRRPFASPCNAPDCAVGDRRKTLGPRPPPTPPDRSSPVSDQPTGVPPGGKLQFDRAERASQTSGSACAVWKQPITPPYYEINGHVTCQRCRSRIIAARDRRPSGTRFASALGLGLLAAPGGAGLDYPVGAAAGGACAI